jgi:endonuclease/exonuclease/phosphatase (EEP) superfamily protein YafD
MTGATVTAALGYAVTVLLGQVVPALGVVTATALYGIAGLMVLAAALLIFSIRATLIVTSLAVTIVAMVVLAQPPIAPSLQEGMTSGTVLWANVRREDEPAMAALRYAHDLKARTVILGEVPTEPAAVLSLARDLFGCVDWSEEERGGALLVASTPPCEAVERSSPPQGGKGWVRLDAGGLALIGLHAAQPPLKPFLRTEYDGQLLRARAAQVRGAAEAARTDPAIVVGDFNDVPWSMTARLPARAGFERLSCDGLDPTWSGNVRGLPVVLPIDLAYARGVAARCRLGPDIGSDHLPLVVEYTIKA